MSKPRILCFDIESTGLKANFATMLCIGWKWLGEPQYTTKVLSVQDTNGVCKCCARIVDPSNDKALLEQVYPVLSEADAWLTWYGKGFDEKFLQTRLLYHRLKPLPPVYHIDGWATPRSKLLLHSNRLKAVQDFLGIKDGKTTLMPEAWQDAMGGGLKGMSYITHHNYKDVIVLEKVYNELLPLISKHPNWNHWTNAKKIRCPNCGNPVQYRGYHHTKRAVQHRIQCQTCGKWDVDPKPLTVAQVKEMRDA